MISLINFSKDIVIKTIGNISPNIRKAFLILIDILVIPFVIGYLVGKQAGIKEAQNNDRVD